MTQQFYSWVFIKKLKTNSKGYTYPDVYRNITYNSQMWKQIKYPLTDEWIYICVCTCVSVCVYQS